MNVKAKINKRIVVLCIVLFFVALGYQLSLSHGISFFWEDFDVYHLYWQDSDVLRVIGEQFLPETIRPKRIVLTLSIAGNYLKQLFVPERLFQIGFDAYSFNDRPYQFLTWDILQIYFNKEVILYRIFKSAVFAISACLVFLIINRISALFALFGVLLYFTTSEVWLSTIYLSHPGPIAQCATLLSVLIFIKLLEKTGAGFKKTCLYYLSILLVSNFAVLTIGDGRYLAIIFLLTILFFRPRQLYLHIIPLSILLLTEFPLLGYIKKFFFARTFSPINLSSHGNTQTSTLSSLLTAFSNFEFVIMALGKLLLLLLGGMILFSLYKYLFNKPQNQGKTAIPNRALSEKLFLFTLWFMATLFMSVRARSLRYGNTLYNFQLYDLAYFIAPFIITSCYYVSLTSRKIFNKNLRLGFIILCSVIFISQIYINNQRLVRTKRVWTDNFVSWQDSKEYVENNSDSALVLAFTEMHYRPFLFYGPKNRVLNTSDSYETSQFCDLSFIDAKFKEGYNDIFVIGSEELSFRGSSENMALKQSIVLNKDCDHLCIYLKNNAGNQYKPQKYIYHFRLK